ncbi:MAG TPA: dihydrofolate reductase family protein, partial [Terriglobales bacterium]|nr:dihydrofolate reductase family protein [Terriglobales bacterium]
MTPIVKPFEVLFDVAERSTLDHPAYGPYGSLAFPAAHRDRPWTYSNFVQSIDGVASFGGLHASGSDISRSAEDRWLMDLLRAHADAVLLGVNTLVEETQLARQTGRGNPRGPVYAIADAGCRDLRVKLGRRREMNIFVTGAAALNLADYAVFDGERLDALIITTEVGAQRLAERKTHPHVRVIV